MAFMRSLSTRGSLIRRRNPQPFSYVLRDDGDHKSSPIEEGPSMQGGMNRVLQGRYFGSRCNNSAGMPMLGFMQNERCVAFGASSSIGISFCRYMSTTQDSGTDKIELMSDVAHDLTDTTVQAVATQAPALNEVAIAAAESWGPVWALQHVLDSVHCYTGFDWWTSIILTTLLMRTATVPLLINQLKSTSKLTLMRPHMEEIQRKVKESDMDPNAVAESHKEMKRLFKEFGVSPVTPLKGLFIQAPIFISFFLAISNMAEKVPSFKTGGAYWFVDLTTPDSLYIFPILTGLSFLITVECNMQEGLEGNPVASTMKKVSRVFAVLSVPLTMHFPKAIFCYWITSNLFSLGYGLVLKAPGVKKALGIPDIPVPPPSSTPQPSFDLFSAFKQHIDKKREEAALSLSEGPSSTKVALSEGPSSTKVADQRVSSSSVLSQRIRTLEKQVKGRKKNKKR